MRPAITLLITLSIIATMLGLMGVMFKYLGATREKAEIKASIIQANLLRADISSLLSKVLGKAPSNSKMKTLFETPIAIVADNKEFGMSLSCSPLADRLNVSWLGLGNNNKKQKEYEMAVDTLNTLANDANIRNPSLLKEKILLSIQQGRNITFGATSRLYKNKDIISFKSFQKILDDYRYQEDDERVYDIDWKRYFSFSTTIQKIDGNFISPELLAYLYEVDLTVVKEGYELGNLSGFLSDIGESTEAYKWLFTKQTLDATQCTANYSFRKGTYSFDFNYHDGRIESFEFYKQ